LVFAMMSGVFSHIACLVASIVLGVATAVVCLCTCYVSGGGYVVPYRRWARPFDLSSTYRTRGAGVKGPVEAVGYLGIDSVAVGKPGGQVGGRALFRRS